MRISPDAQEIGLGRGCDRLRRELVYLSVLRNRIVKWHRRRDGRGATRVVAGQLHSGSGRADSWPKELNDARGGVPGSGSPQAAVIFAISENAVWLRAHRGPGIECADVVGRARPAFR